MSQTVASKRGSKLEVERSKIDVSFLILASAGNFIESEEKRTSISNITYVLLFWPKYFWMIQNNKVLIFYKQYYFAKQFNLY